MKRINLANTKVRMLAALAISVSTTVAALVFAAWAILFATSLRFEPTQVTKTDIAGLTEVKFKFDYPKNWEISGVGFESNYVKGEDRSTKCYLTILDRDTSKDFVSQIKGDLRPEQGWEIKDYKGKRTLERKYSTQSLDNAKDEMFIMEGYYLDENLQSSLVRLTCYGSKEDDGTIKKVYKRFVESLKIEN